MEGHGECWGKTSTYDKCESITLVREKVKKFREDAEEKQEGVQGQWQRESPAKESAAMTLIALALKGGDWEAHKSIFRVQAKATEWALDRVPEALEKVAKDEAKKLSTVQEVM